MSVGCSPHNGGARSLEDKLSGRLARRLCVDLCPRLPDARRPHRDGAACTGAVVRKPPGKEPTGDWARK
jgi:hypothetical protein